jgi:hypothetical protein
MEERRGQLLFQGGFHLLPVIGNKHCLSRVNWSCVRLLQARGKKSVSANGKRNDKIWRAGELVTRRPGEDYLQVKTEIDLETVEVGDDAYVWLTVDSPDLIDKVRAAASNYAEDFWEAEEIFIVPRMQ